MKYRIAVFTVIVFFLAVGWGWYHDCPDTAGLFVSCEASP